MQYTDFDKDFIQRTLDILSDYKAPWEVTLLINCLVGLLILPKEKLFEKIPDFNIQDLTDDWGIKPEHITDIRCPSCGYKLRNVIRQMRNSVAHMRVKAFSDGKDIEILEFRDTGFAARIPVESLKVFAIKLATTVSNHIRGLAVKREN
jgi:hypothetical protein